MLPPDSHRRDRTFLFDRILEVHIVLLSEFLEACRPDFIPYQAVETLHLITAKNLEPHAAVHETQQVKLANGIQRIYHLNFPRGSELLDALISSKIFALYFDAGQPQMSPEVPPNSRPGHAWLQDLSARAQISDTLADYMTSSGNPERIRAILGGLASLHTS
jgi:hypothetical protein